MAPIEIDKVMVKEMIIEILKESGSLKITTGGYDGDISISLSIDDEVIIESNIAELLDTSDFIRNHNGYEE